MRILRPSALVAFGVALGCASVAGAFTVPPSAISDGTPGEVRLLSTQPVDPADVGKSCEVTVVSTNNESVRPGSDLIVESGTSSMVASDVEHDTASHTFVGQLTLGTTITVSVRFGPEGMYSGGSSVETACPTTQPITTPAAPETVVQPTVETATSPPAPTAAAAVRAAPSFTG
jgi:hypothetical protein